MRWNNYLTLLSPVAKYQDAAGAWHDGEYEERVVYCNEMTIGSMTLAHLRSSTIRTVNTTEPVDVGTYNEHLLEIRTIDYSGEDKVIFDGKEYEVISAYGAGEKRQLIIGQRVGNSGMPEGGEYDG